MIQVYHFIGIGGIGMSALAAILLEQGYPVSGSDIKKSAVTEALSNKGAHIYYSQRKEHIQPDAIVVYSTDIKESNPERIAAKEQGNLILHRSELLEKLLAPKKAIVIAGAHGKTTTTALLAHVLTTAGWDPSYVIGGFSPSLPSNGHFGKGEYFIAEGDESDGSFLRTRPHSAILTNVDYDHLNYWGSPENLLNAYRQFIKQVGHLFFWHDDPHLSEWQPSGTSYGFSPLAYASATEWFQEGQLQLFHAEIGGKEFLEMQLNLFGQHNTLNALGVISLSLSLGVKESDIRKALLTFKGVKRRLEYKGEVGGAHLFDDYAHHPQEIEATLKALKGAYPGDKIVALFQPHRYTRLSKLMDEFAASLHLADQVIITDIYSAGEDPIEGVTIEALLARAPQATYVPRSELAAFLRSEKLGGSIVVTLGAGDITRVADEIYRS